MIKIHQALTASWKESLSLLVGKNLGMLLLLALRSTLSLYRALCYAWFLPTALLAGLVLNEKRLMFAFLVALYARATRPSLENKKVDYWRQFFIADWVIFFGLLGIVEGPHFLLSAQGYGIKFYNLLLKLFLLQGHAWLPGSEVLAELLLFFSPLVILWVLFILDARVSVSQYLKAFWRAVIMMVYNYPFFVIVFEIVRLTLAACYFIGNYFCSRCDGLPLIGWLILLFVFLPYYVCFITNMYIKRVHEQFNLYY